MPNSVQQCLDLLTEKSSLWESRGWGQYVSKTFETFGEAKELAVELTKKIDAIFKTPVTSKNVASMSETKAAPKGNHAWVPNEHVELESTPISLLESAKYPGKFRVEFEVIALLDATPPKSYHYKVSDLDRLDFNYSQQFVSRVMADMELKKTASPLPTGESKSDSADSVSVQALVKRALRDVIGGTAPICAAEDSLKNSDKLVVSPRSGIGSK